MKLLFFIFIISVIVYINRVDILGPRILIESGKSLDFSLGQEVSDWNEYFELNDRFEGKLDDKYMQIYAEDLNMQKPGVQYLYVKAQDKLGNVSSRSFEVTISSGYNNIDFEQLVNNQALSVDMHQFQNLNITSNPSGLDANNTNAKISRYLGSQSLEVDIESSDKFQGIKLPITILPNDEYYLKYDVHVTNPVTNDLLLPVLSNTNTSAPIQLAVTDDYHLKIIDNVNNQSKVIEKSNLNNGMNTIELGLLIDNQLGGPDLVEIKLNDKVVRTIDYIDLGFEQVDQVLLQVTNQSKRTEDNKINIDNVKYSMVEKELIG